MWLRREEDDLRFHQKARSLHICQLQVSDTDMTTLARVKLLSKPAVRQCTAVASSRVLTGAVFVEKTLEQPVIVLNEQDNVDIIGPPDPVSNLRPVIRKVLLNESEVQKRLRLMHNATQLWNQQFWEKHNSRFIKEKQNYISSRQVQGEETKHLNADEMSQFYKEFLDQNWKIHVAYNVDWYKKNFTLLFLAFRVCIEKIVRV